MIQGIGIDIIEISRIQDVYRMYGDSFLDRVYSKNEISYCFGKKDPFPHLAGRFAAKEAFIKAVPLIRTKKFHLKDIEIMTDPRLKKPDITLYGITKEAFSGMDDSRILVSISHSKTHAVAQVIIALP